jgi:hypothetical protein
MEPLISFAGWLLVVAFALFFAGQYLQTREKLVLEKKDRIDLKEAFTGLQRQYQEVCLDRDRLEANARQIAQDRDKAYDRVEELTEHNTQQWIESKAASAQLEAIQLIIQKHGYVWDTTITSSANVEKYLGIVFRDLKSEQQARGEFKKNVDTFMKAKAMVDQLVAAAREIKPRGAVKKATYQRLQDALANFREGGAA